MSVEALGAPIPRDWYFLHHSQVETGKSTLDGARFFLHPEGRDDANMEWVETVRLFAQEAKSRALGQIPASHDLAKDYDPAQPLPPEELKKIPLVCRYPGRAALLRNEGLSVADIRCPTYDDWARRLTPKTISLVYTSAYANNPASVLGHLFLKLNLDPEHRASGQTHPLLDYALSFSAVPTSDGLLYLLQGLTGGFKGFFFLAPFYEKVHEYAFSENRDLWEYEFAIPSDRRALLVGHIWELLTLADADYYFMDDNCAYFVLEVLELALGRPLSIDAPLIVTPHEALREVLRNVPAQKIHFEPSRRKRFGQLLEQLNAREREVFDSLIDRDLSVVVQAEFASASPWVLETYLEWLNLQKARTPENKEVIATAEKMALVERSQRGKKPARGPIDEKLMRSNRPDLSHPSTRAIFGIGHRYNSNGVQRSVAPEGASGVQDRSERESRDSESFAALRLRYGTHEVGDPALGHEPAFDAHFFHLEILQTFPSSESIASTESRELNESPQTFVDLRLLELLSLTPWTAYEKRFSWSVRGGMRSANYNTRENQTIDSRLISLDDGVEIYGGGSYGLTHAFGAGPLDAVIYAMPAGEVGVLKAHSYLGRADLGIQLGWHIPRTWGGFRLDGFFGGRRYGGSDAASVLGFTEDEVREWQSIQRMLARFTYSPGFTGSDEPVVDSRWLFTAEYQVSNLPGDQIFLGAGLYF